MFASRGPGSVYMGAIGSVVFRAGLQFQRGAESMHHNSVWTRKKQIRVYGECRAKSVDSARVPTGSVQCKVYLGASSVPEAEEKIRANS